MRWEMSGAWIDEDLYRELRREEAESGMSLSCRGSRGGGREGGNGRPGGRAGGIGAESELVLGGGDATDVRGTEAGRFGGLQTEDGFHEPEALVDVGEDLVDAAGEQRAGTVFVGRGGAKLPGSHPPSSSGRGGRSNSWRSLGLVRWPSRPFKSRDQAAGSSFVFDSM